MNYKTNLAIMSMAMIMVAAGCSSTAPGASVPAKSNPVIEDNRNMQNEKDVPNEQGNEMEEKEIVRKITQINDSSIVVDSLQPPEYLEEREDRKNPKGKPGKGQSGKQDPPPAPKEGANDQGSSNFQNNNGEEKAAPLDENKNKQDQDNSSQNNNNTPENGNGETQDQVSNKLSTESKTINLTENTKIKKIEDHKESDGTKEDLNTDSMVKITLDDNGNAETIMIGDKDFGHKKRK